MRLGILLVVILLAPRNLTGQPIFFNQISQEDGLRNGNVRAIVKDFQGFVWIGTEDGLHRFDGNQMKIYRHTDSDSLSLSSNFILGLFEDTFHNLWVGTLDAGLCLYDRHNDTFRRITFASEAKNSSRGVRNIMQAKDGYLYVGSDDLFRAKLADPLTMEFERVTIHADSFPMTGARVMVVNEGDGPNILVGINNSGLHNYNTVSGISSVHPISRIERDIQTLYVDRKRNLLWVGTWRNGLLVYNPATRQHRYFRADQPGGLKSNFIASITGDSEGNIWIGTDHGLTLIPPDADPWKPETLDTFLQDQEDRSGIQGTIVKVVYVDQQDLVWVGMYYEGINVYDRKAMNFGSLPIAIGDRRSIKFGNINAIQEDKHGGIWLGVDGGGLFHTKGKLGSRDAAVEAVTTCTNTDKIKSLEFDEQGNLWIGTWGDGVSRIDANTGKCSLLSDLNRLVGREVLSVNADLSGNIWIGTFNQGLYRHNISGKVVTRIKSKDGGKNPVDRINAILVDRNNNVWIGREVGGLGFLKSGFDTYTFIETEHLNLRTTILSLYIDGEGIVWAGVANKGLVRYDPQTKTSLYFGEESGLANSYIQAIQEDSLQRIWISHNMGLSVFHKKNQTFTNFSRSNGLSASQYNRNSVVRMSDGRIAFGNIRGVNFFDPARFRKQEKTIPLAFTKFLLNNVEQQAGTAVLPKNITTIEEVRLKHDQNSFGIEFASLEYDFAQFREYAYMLEGYDTEWNRTGNSRRLISYTNLPPGEYTFKVMIAKNSDEQVSGWKEVRIVIVAAWWQTISFKLLVAALAAAIILIVFRIRMRFLINQRRQLAQKVQERTMELNKLNTLLQSQIGEINSMNTMLQAQQKQILEKNNEIQAQNEELVSQNEQIIEQHDSLSRAQAQLKEVNVNLEHIVNRRTEELQRTIKDLNKTVFELDRFVYSASHDLSAPLKSIRGLVELINIEKDPVTVLQYSTHIKNTVLKLETVIRSMVDYARNTHALVKAEKFCLKEIIDEVVSEVSFWPEAANIRYINLVPEDITIMSDKARIKIVLLNLVTNAIKYSDRNKESSWLRFEYTSIENGCQLTVTDNGIGIRKEYLDKIFKMYFRATETSKGSGLGLFIVSEVIDKIGGNISVESEFGVQTKFEVLIPDKMINNA
ncbi:MAG TPA: two-component regulator propeller domain-containing protein [Chryseolinea sp.]